MNMNKKKILILALFSLSCISNSSAQIDDLKKWLETPIKSRVSLTELSFSNQSLTKSQSEIAARLLLADKRAQLMQNHDDQWNNRLLKVNDLKMPFYYQIFGNTPKDGRSLFISLHGGGGAPASVNDRQYKNQQHLYDATMKDMEGVYMALRAPTNTWDLWHQSHIDDFLNIIIQMAIIKEQVNPNKVYLLGYSAGGDGLFQLAPRMADRWAAASMMAGHPGDASPLGLRNLPFAVHMGALDSAYKRNEWAKHWGTVLDSLKNDDPDGYIHDVQVHEGLGHWMKLKDAVALPWMQGFQRNPRPKKVIWVQDNRHHASFYWLGTPKNAITDYGKIIVEYDGAKNEIRIIENYSDSLEIFLDDDMLNLDKPITVKYQDMAIFQGKPKRTILNLFKTLNSKGDPNLTFPCIVSIKNNETVK